MAGEEARDEELSPSAAFFWAWSFLLPFALPLFRLWRGLGFGWLSMPPTMRPFSSGGRTPPAAPGPSGRRRWCRREGWDGASRPPDAGGSSPPTDRPGSEEGESCPSTLPSTLSGSCLPGVGSSLKPLCFWLSGTTCFLAVRDHP